jgi:hypothetical protein
MANNVAFSPALSSITIYKMYVIKSQLIYHVYFCIFSVRLGLFLQCEGLRNIIYLLFLNEFRTK